MEVTDVGRRRERKKKKGEGGGEGGKRDLDGHISRLTILMCKGRLYTNVFSRTALVFILCLLFLFQ